MLDAVERHYGIAHRWFRHQGRHPRRRPARAARPVRADRRGPLGRTTPRPGGLIDASFGRFSPRIADLADGFFDERRIDAEPRSGKRGGAFCAPVAQDASPYVLMNFTDRMDDVMTLAHELGPRHALHPRRRARRRRSRSAPGIALAEVPSTFAELLTFDHLMEIETDPATRRSLISERVEGSFATVFRQTVLTRYEQRAYALRAEGGTLTADRLSEIWFEENAKYYGDAVGPARALPAGLVVHPALHLDALLHLRLRLRAPVDAGALRALPRGRAPTSWTPTSASCRPAARRTPAELLGGARRGPRGPRGLGARASARWSDWWRLAEAG